MTVELNVFALFMLCLAGLILIGTILNINYKNSKINELIKERDDYRDKLDQKTLEIELILSEIRIFSAEAKKFKQFAESKLGSKVSPEHQDLINLASSIDS